MQKSNLITKQEKYMFVWKSNNSDVHKKLESCPFQFPGIKNWKDAPPFFSKQKVHNQTQYFSQDGGDNCWRTVAPCEVTKSKKDALFNCQG